MDPEFRVGYATDVLIRSFVRLFSASLTERVFCPGILLNFRKCELCIVL